MDTEALAAELEKRLASGENLALLIGGPEGLAPECLKQADESWALSRLTLAHPVVRVVLAEQLYRAWSIINNLPYHREHTVEPPAAALCECGMLPPRTQGFFLCSCKERNQRKHAPDGTTARCASRLCRAVARRDVPVAARNPRASCPRPFGLAGKGWRCARVPYGFFKKPRRSEPSTERGRSSARARV
jgi:hypothetical protein